MRFYVDHDLGALSRCWVAPDNPVAISRIYVTLEGRRVAELDAWLVDDVIRLQGWHSTGQCVFEITDAQAPGISQARRVELYDADTNVLIYRRSPRTDLIQAKVVLVDTSIIGDSAIQSVLFDHFQQSYFGVGTLSDEVLRVLFESPWMTSSFFSGLILMPRYEGSFVGDEILTTTLIHDPYVEMATRLLWLKARAAITADPAQAWRRLAGRMRKPREIAVLMEVAGWREAEAQSRNVPRGRILKDEAVIDIATSAPRSVEALGRLRTIPAGFERSRTGSEILAAVERGFARDLSQIAAPERSRSRGGGSGALVDLLKVLLKAVAEAEGVAPKIIATVDDLEALAEDDAADVPVLQGWRRSLFGERALALKHGRMALSVERGRVVVRDLP